MPSSPLNQRPSSAISLGVADARVGNGPMTAGVNLRNTLPPSRSQENGSSAIHTIETERHATRQKVHLIWTGGTIACVLRSELCGPEFADEVNTLLRMEEFPRTALELRDMILGILEKVNVPKDRLKYQEQLLSMIENVFLHSATPQEMIDRLKMEFEVSVPGLTGNDFINQLPHDLHTKYQFIVHHPFAVSDAELSFGIDSTEMNPDKMERIGKEIDSILQDPSSRDGHIIVTHGTDTMANSAAYQSFRYALGIDRPIVFTGSQIRPGDPLTDAHNNFALALKASDIPCGEVLIAFGETVSRGVAASKVQSVTKEGFTSPHQPNIGKLRGSHLTIEDNNLIPRRQDSLSDIQTYPGLSGRSAVISMDPALAANHAYLREAIVNPKLHNAVVLVGYAAGNVPPGIAHIIEEVSQDMLVIIAPSGATHGQPQTLYEGSPDISHPGAIFAKAMVPAVASMKFQWLYRRAVELGIPEDNKRAILEFIRSRFLFNYVNEFPHNPANGIGNVEKNTRVKHLLLHSIEPIHTSDDYTMAYNRVKMAWLNEWAIQFNLSDDDRVKWIENRKHVDIPTETIFGLWDSAKNDKNWHVLSSSEISTITAYERFAAMVKAINRQSKFDDINPLLAQHILHEWKTFVTNMINRISQKSQDFHSVGGGNGDPNPSVLSDESKKELTRDIIESFLGNYFDQGGTFVFSKKELYEVVCNRLAVNDPELRTHLLKEWAEERKEETMNLPEDLKELLCRSLVLITDEIVTNIIVTREETISRPEEYAQVRMGMTLDKFAEIVRTQLLASHIGTQMKPHVETGESIINLPTIRHEIYDLINQYQLHQEVVQMERANAVREIAQGLTDNML